MKVILNQSLPWRDSGVAGIRRATLWNAGEDVAAELCAMAKDSEYPDHQHAAWEQMLVLEGRIDVDGTILSAGDYAFTRPGESHRVLALSDARVFLSFGQALTGG